MPKDPCSHPTKATGFSSFRAIHADVLKGMISYRIGFSECEHGRASNGQHARNGFFNESFQACQGLISGISEPENSLQNFCPDLSQRAPIARLGRRRLPCADRFQQFWRY